MTTSHILERTASELKVKQVQGNATATAGARNDTARYGIGIDMSSGTADEAADRALSSVARKLDKTLSVEYTVNDLIAEATDVVNLATMFPGQSYLKP
jgi:ataxia telangiectasia mutated family protein